MTLSTAADGCLFCLLFSHILESGMMLTNIPPLTFAFVAALGGSILNAMLGYLLNVVNLSVFQLIIMRLVSANFSAV